MDMLASPIHSGERNWLETLLKTKFRYDALREFQLDGISSLIQMRDIFVVVATGMGKTTILLGPLLAAQDRGQSGIALIIVPTKRIAEQQVSSRNCRS